MQVFVGLCTGKVTLSYWMLQNTLQNVQEIDTANVSVQFKNVQCPFDQRTKAISAVQSSWQTMRITLTCTMLTKIQTSRKSQKEQQLTRSIFQNIDPSIVFLRLI